MSRAYFLAITHVVTDDSPIGEPWPPAGDGFWYAVAHHRGRTSWRHVGLYVGDPSVPDPSVERLYQEVASALSQSEGRRIANDFDFSLLDGALVDEVVAKVIDLINELPP